MQCHVETMSSITQYSDPVQRIHGVTVDLIGLCKTRRHLFSFANLISDLDDNGR